MIRSILFNIVFYTFFILYIAILYPVTYFCSANMTLKLSYRPVTRWLLFCLKYLAKIDYKISGLENIPSGQFIIGCNHQSAWETFIFSILFDNLAIVIKKELLNKPIAGLYFKKLGCIPIDRSSPIKAIKTLMISGTEAYENGNSILIFPNGTRASSHELVEYKSGIYALYKTLQIPVIPAHVNSGEHWARNSFRKIPGTIQLDFKPPIAPGLDKSEFFDKFEKEINQ
ncbi:MAG: 1-acyl-sn-glycerol-3-phosphate acyltransferase [Alphaproteobacteria bacterium]|nr:1-acyl-sn-glycerol-3-phosphate acyltransferase [Alphaproteobacteria bacterium]